MSMRRAVFVVSVCVATMVTLPSRAHAIPVMDWRTSMAHLQNFLGQLSLYYGAMRNYRDLALDKAAVLDGQARELIAKRRKYERELHGELGGLGRGIPDWRDHANVCRHGSYRGYNVCTIDQRAYREINRQVARAFRRANDLMYTGADNMHDQVREVLGRNTSAVLDQARSLGERPINQLTRHLEAQGEASFHLEQMAEDIHGLVEAIVSQEDLGEMVSSGRATQLSAHISVVEAQAQLEIVRQRASYLRASAVDGMDRVGAVRVQMATHSLGKRF
jgi:hypothetical protein